MENGANSNMEDREVLYVGRFEIEVYGSFLQAKRASQTWCNQVKKFHSSTPLHNTQNINTGNSLSDSINKLGYVYYSDNDKKWVVVSENGKIEFSVENLGHSEAKKQAISLRYKNISN